MPRKPSDLTVTDQFCGAGGSSIGAASVGARLRMALNHWKLAIETHNTNFPDADHDCTDVSACDPRRYPSTDILITSPECTNHSLAKGKKRKGLGQFDAFTPPPIDPAEERSRATMWDVPRFAEFHRYNLVVVENVVDARHWEPYPAWLKAMDCLGYNHREVFLNSMFAHPTPQSRDRMYVVFWRKGNKAPDLEFTPPAWCPGCERNVEAVQAWKNPHRRWGRYRQQYVYRCPTCAGEVLPYYYCALNAIDWTIPAERIGDKKRPLRPRTLERIRFGLEKYGRQPLQIITNMTTDNGRVRSLAEAGFTQTGSMLAALVSPFLVETGAFGSMGERVASSGAEALRTQTTRQTAGLIMPFLVNAGGRDVEARGVDGPVPTLVGSDRLGVVLPFLVNTRNGSRLECRVRGGDEPLGTQTATGFDFGVAIPPAFVMTYRQPEGGAGYSIRGLDDPLRTIVTAAQERLILSPAALVTLRDMKRPEQLVRGLDGVLGTQVASGVQDALVSRSPYLVQFNRTGNGAGMHEAIPTVSTHDRCGVVEPGPELSVEDCYFRMLKSREIGRGMAFPGEYVVLGNESQRVRQYGNAVTPPAMKFLIGRGIDALTGERAA